MKTKQYILDKLDKLINEAEEVLKTEPREATLDYLEVDFKKELGTESYYKWASTCVNLLKNHFGEDNIYYETFNASFKASANEAKSVLMCKGILRAARDDYQSDDVTNLSTLLRVEIITEILGQAQEALKGGDKNRAYIISTTALELALRFLGDLKGVRSKKVDKINGDLRKKKVYNAAKEKQIKSWLEMNDDCSGDDVGAMITGVNGFVADYL
ncbi:hypothetical protein [Halonatronum saccharophilum]|uniref:hypothetical protein n=1 Tax=Halonatronum saccharophilum TaxID=150060 RepID=UPI0004837BE3|nr:hypothetical protein [Halonatronum saccharophilum]